MVEARPCRVCNQRPYVYENCTPHGGTGYRHTDPETCIFRLGKALEGLERRVKELDNLERRVKELDKQVTSLECAPTPYVLSVEEVEDIVQDAFDALERN